MFLAVLWLFSSVTVTPDNQQPPPPALIEKVEANLNVTRCFRRPFRLRREYSYVGWTSGFDQRFNRNQIEFWIAEANSSNRKAGLFISFLRLPSLDDSNFTFMTGVYNFKKGRVISGGCFNNSTH
jgi:hypothetical protein